MRMAGCKMAGDNLNVDPRVLMRCNFNASRFHKWVLLSYVEERQQPFDIAILTQKYWIVKFFYLFYLYKIKQNKRL